MHKLLRSAFSFILLGLFLFPMAEKSVHVASHHIENQCRNHEKHFCQHEHHCAHCDVSYTPFLASLNQIFEQKVVLVYNSLVQTNPVQVEVAAQHTSNFLRGPPAA